MIKLLNIYHKLQEANVDNDLEYTDLAQAFFDKFEKSITNKSMQHIIQSDKLQSSVIAYYAKDIDPTYYDLYIFITPHKYTTKMFDGGSNGGYSFGITSKNEGRINCNAMYNEDFENPRILLDEESFIHEFIHYLDFKRSSDGKLRFGYTNNNEYYNNDSEFNAYYQMTSAKIVKQILRDSHYLWLITDKLKTFKIFKEWIIEMFDKEFIATLNDRYMKKFNKRLYTLYMEFINKSKDL